jgi:uncharacterized protein YoxC
MDKYDQKQRSDYIAQESSVASGMITPEIRKRVDAGHQAMVASLTPSAYLVAKELDLLDNGFVVEALSDSELSTALERKLGPSPTDRVLDQAKDSVGSAMSRIDNVRDGTRMATFKSTMMSLINSIPPPEKTVPAFLKRNDSGSYAVTAARPPSYPRNGPSTSVEVDSSYLEPRTPEVRSGNMLRQSPSREEDQRREASRYVERQQSEVQSPRVASYGANMLGAKTLRYQEPEPIPEQRTPQEPIRFTESDFPLPQPAIVPEYVQRFGSKPQRPFEVQATETVTALLGQAEEAKKAVIEETKVGTTAAKDLMDHFDKTTDDITQKVETVRRQVTRRNDRRKTRRSIQPKSAQVAKDIVIKARSYADRCSADVMNSQLTLDKDLEQNGFKWTEETNLICVYRNDDVKSYMDLKKKLNADKPLAKQIADELIQEAFRPWHLFTNYNLGVAQTHAWTASSCLFLQGSSTNKITMQFFNLDDKPTDFDLEGADKGKWKVALPIRSPIAAVGLLKSIPKDFALHKGFFKKDLSTTATMVALAMAEEQADTDKADQQKDLIKEAAYAASEMALHMFCTDNCCWDLMLDLTTALYTDANGRQEMRQQMKTSGRKLALPDRLINPADPDDEKAIAQLYGNGPDDDKNTSDDQDEDVTVFDKTNDELRLAKEQMLVATKRIEELQAQLAEAKTGMIDLQATVPVFSPFSSFNMADPIPSPDSFAQDVETVYEASVAQARTEWVNIPDDVLVAYHQSLGFVPAPAMKYLAANVDSPLLKRLVMSYGRNGFGVAYPWVATSAFASSQRIKVLQHYQDTELESLISVMVRPFSHQI